MIEQAPRILLVDNGSRRAEATHNLRRIAAALAAVSGQPIVPVSLLHSDQIPAAALDGQPAHILATALEHGLAQGVRNWCLIPLFFGLSRALTDHIPQICAGLRARFGAFRCVMADPLCPLPEGEPRLVTILADQVSQVIPPNEPLPTQIILVDHGSPLARVSAVRHWLAQRLAVRGLLPAPVSEAVMERRPGAQYDFNGALLTTVLDQQAVRQPEQTLVLAMLFLGAGRHAGAGGDITTICNQAMTRHPGLSVRIAPLVGEHPLLIEILADRVRAQVQ